MTLVDTAAIYGSRFGDAEALLGQVLARNPGWRGRMVLATKGGIEPGVPYDSSDGYLQASLEASLRRLGVDHVDLMQVHRPDLLTHPADLARTLTSMVASGKVRHIGVSNFTAAQLRALLAHLDVPVVTTQPELSVLEVGALDDGVLDQAMELGITPLAWSPLGGGRLVAQPPADTRIARVQHVMQELAAGYDATLTQIALAFVLAHPSGAIPIIGTTKPERVRESAGAASVALTKADCYRLIAASGRALP
jgi:predicted oxidoreductase